MTQVRIENLESLQGRVVILALTNGGTIEGVLQSVSHLDKWDDILVNDIVVRSTSVKRIFVKDPRQLFWSEDAFERGELEVQASETPLPDSSYYDPEIYSRAVALIDQMVVVEIGDSGHKEYGVLEAVTPRTKDILPALELGPVEEGDPTISIQIKNVTAINKHVFTHDEADAVISQEGVPEEESSSTPDTVEVQREKARGVHSPKDAEAAFGLTSETEEDGDTESAGATTEVDNEPDADDGGILIGGDVGVPPTAPASTVEDDESARKKTSSLVAVNDAGGIRGVGFEPGKSGQPLTSEDPGVAPLDTTEKEPKKKKARRRRKK